MFTRMKKYLSALWLFCELITGFTFIGYGAFQLFIDDPEAQICTEISICAADSRSLITPWLFVCFGMLVIIIWYLTVYLPLREKESQFIPSVKPEDFVK